MKSGAAKRSSGRLAGGLVHREVIALLEPGLEAELDLPTVSEAQGADLGLELLGDGAVPALDGAPPLAHVGRAVAECDAEVGTGEGELVGAVDGAIVDVEASDRPRVTMACLRQCSSVAICSVSYHSPCGTSLE